MGSIGGEALKGHLDLILLSALEQGPAYGYLIVSQIQEDSEGLLSLSDGTIYPALHRLERAKLLSSFHEITAGRRRRIYRLTPAGIDKLEKLKGEWRNFSGAIERLLVVHHATAAGRRHVAWTAPATATSS